MRGSRHLVAATAGSPANDHRIQTRIRKSLARPPDRDRGEEGDGLAERGGAGEVVSYCDDDALVEGCGGGIRDHAHAGA